MDLEACIPNPQAEACSQETINPSRVASARGTLPQYGAQ